MTTPGYPDFQDYPTWITPPIGTSGPVSLPPGMTTLFSGPVTNFASLYVNVITSAGFGRVILNWFADSALTQLVASSNFGVPVNMLAEILAGVKTSFLQVQFNNTSGGTVTATVTVAGSNTQVSGVDNRLPSANLTRVNGVVAASSTLITPFTRVTGGQASVYVDPPDAAGKISYTLIGTDEAGAEVGEFAAFPNQVGIALVNLIIGKGQALAWKAVNSDTVPHNQTFNVSVAGG